MKKLLLAILFISLLNSCNSDDKGSTTPPFYDPSLSITRTNEAYGSDPQQTMDVYLPAGRTSDTKTVIFIHGGAWAGGDKSNHTDFIHFLQGLFPGYAIVNLNYRLATPTSPAYPKQIDDIGLAMAKLKSSNYTLSGNYAFIGSSAGGHLAMLYSYAFDQNHDIKAVANFVGPVDFTDPNYPAMDSYTQFLYSITGSENPEVSQIEEISPPTHITATSAPTISFYGGQDPLMPATQGPRLHGRLDEMGVTNQLYLFPDGGHNNWDNATFEQVYTSMVSFIQQNLSQQ